MKKPVNIGGKLYKVLTITELGKLLNRSTHTLRQYEKRKILPRSNFRLPPTITRSGREIEGLRIYTEELAHELKTIFLNISQGKRITEEQALQIRSAFLREKTRTLNNGQGN